MANKFPTRLRGKHLGTVYFPGRLTKQQQRQLKATPAIHPIVRYYATTGWTSIAIHARSTADLRRRRARTDQASCK